MQNTTKGQRNSECICTYVFIDCFVGLTYVFKRWILPLGKNNFEPLLRRAAETKRVSERGGDYRHTDYTTTSLSAAYCVMTLPRLVIHAGKNRRESSILAKLGLMPEGLKILVLNSLQLSLNDIDSAVDAYFFQIVCLFLCFSHDSWLA